MKFLNKVLLVVCITLFSACEMFELDLLDDPNAITPENASVNDLYNNIQLTFRNIYNGVQTPAGQMARMYSNINGFNYESSTGPTTLNGVWFSTYSAMFPDIDALLAIAEERGLDIHSGTAKIMKAYALVALVDMLGSVPNAQAGQGTDVISPASDDGASIYAAANALLDEAVAELTGTNAGAPTNDLFYGGNADNWIKFANTLKLRNAVTTRLVDGSAASTVNSLVSGGMIIDETSEDFQFNFGNQRTNPNSRHPFYNNHYEQGDGAYLSNYYMWKLRLDKVDAAGSVQIDPRIRFYFRRKIEDAVNQDPTTYSCHFSTLPLQEFLPDHHIAVDPRLPYCVASEDGYSGRDHLNGEGIPPDGPTRTSYGLYPGGGSFDGNDFNDTRNAGTTGGLGQGIYPIMLASYAYFLRAEAALTLGTSDDARAMLESGMRTSIDKVIGFKSLVPAEMSRQIDDRGVISTVEESFVPDAADIDAYVNFVLAAYDAADDAGKLDIIITEYYIAAWGNGLEAYNAYRRTGYPGNMQPGIEPNVGNFVQSFFLPDVHVNRNASASQKSLTDLVFWNDGSAVVY